MGVLIHKLSLAEYMAWEAEQEGRNEFHRGEVFAMVGGCRGHGRIIANLVRHQGNHLGMSDGNALSLESVGCEIELAAVFQGMEGEERS